MAHHGTLYELNEGPRSREIMEMELCHFCCLFPDKMKKKRKSIEKCYSAREIPKHHLP